MTPEVEPDGVLHSESRPDRYWSTANVGEALPGVITPLGWSVWGPAIELGMRDAFARTGALERSRVVVPADASERVITVFYGRGALSVNFLCEMGDRLPGTSGDAIARQLLGEVPVEIPLKRNLDRLPAVAVNMPVAFALIRKQVIEGAATMPGWWSAWLAQMDTLDIPGVRVALDDARKKLCDMTAIQARGVFVGVQAMYDQLLALIERAGLDSDAANALMAGHGSHAETQIISDLWSLGRGQLTLDAFLADHGYHGPREGELMTKVWREDPDKVLHLAAQYADRPDAEHPAITAERRTRERREAERALLDALPRWQRVPGAVVLRLAAQRIPLRGVAKEALQRALDIVRASGRRMGVLLVEQGVLPDADDAFFFTADELIAGLPENAAEIAAERRALRAELEKYDIPQHWGGNPVPFALDSVDGGGAERVSGIAASGGVVEGTVRLVHDPAFTDVEDDEVIVCPTTDPSWASVLFLCSALVVDIGGPLSHAAVVSRELGIPCVIGTNNGTAVLRTGDRVRVDGNTGVVEVLSRAPRDEGAPA
ncbi:MAG TPA: PEP-utilizing enzyme [Solirubrobacteraceae bacterium]|jgi:pyruvate,water dikinase|nr:PEP-utilizing enzyme [Solirubrobacteraceae bacterium]